MRRQLSLASRLSREPVEGAIPPATHETENAMRFKSWHFALIFYPTLACVMLWVMKSPAQNVTLGLACWGTLVLLAESRSETSRLRARVEQLEQRARSEQSGT